MRAGAGGGRGVAAAQLEASDDEDGPVGQARWIEVEGTEGGLLAHPEAGVAPRPRAGRAHRQLPDADGHRCRVLMNGAWVPDGQYWFLMKTRYGVTEAPVP